jgi:uncharacterized protein (DUF1330 family)
MAVYVIVDIKVNEPVEYAEYKKLAGPTVGAYGGRYVVRGGAAEVLEGEWVPNRLVILEFPTAAQAKIWWGSAEYSVAKAIRHRTAHTNMVLVDGL